MIDRFDIMAHIATEAGSSKAHIATEAGSSLRSSTVQATPIGSGSWSPGPVSLNHEVSHEDSA